ncbi:MAG: phenylacetate--CoA ligase family protein [Nitrospirae bacterium]|nr:phenylacetate--CoA ligase family protein [Nitrospirota bacterium]
MRWTDISTIARDLVFLLRSQGWPEDKIIRYREKRLIRIMKHAVSQVPFYKSLGISPNSIRTAQDLKRFPVVTKRDIQKNDDGFLWPQLKKEGLHVSRSSGTSCEPTQTYFDHRCWLFSKYALKMSRIVAVENPLFKRLLIVSEQTNTNLEETKPSRWKSALILFGQRHLSIFDNVDDHIPVLLNYKPHILYAFPSYLLSLIQAFEEKHLPYPKIPVIFTSSELLTGKARTQIENCFQARLYDVYGSTEFKEVAWQCRQGRYHINFQNVYLETEPNESMEAFGDSRLLISSLTNYAMPLLRFDIGDRAELGQGRCPCGRPSPYLRNIHGREADFIQLPDGKRVSPYLLTMTIEAHPSIQKYQIVQKSATELTIEFIARNDVDTHGISEALSGKLQKLLDGHIHITFNKVDQIHRSESGKFQIIKKTF